MTNHAPILKAEYIVKTVERLRARITERFPESGLAKVAADLSDTARATPARVEELAKPNYLLRAAAVAAIAGGLFAQIYFAEIIVPYLGTFTKQMGRPFAVRWSARLKTALHPVAQIAVIAAAAFDWPHGGAHSWAAQAALGLAVLASLAYLVDHAVLAARRVTQRA